MKQIDYCPFVENKNPECETPPCNSCYLNCIHKPTLFKESLAKAIINNKRKEPVLSINEITNKLNKGISRSINT